MNARILVEKVAQKSLEGWPQIAAYEKQQLHEAKMIARAMDRQQAAVNQLRKRTAKLREAAKSEFKDVGDPDPEMSLVFQTAIWLGFVCK